MERVQLWRGSRLNSAWFIPLILLLMTGLALATPCVVPDNGAGTATLPPLGCDYTSQTDVYEIIDGLPPGTTIELDGPLGQFLCDGGSGVCSFPLAPGECEAPGGTLGGDSHCYSGALDLNVTGTGDLAGFNRVISIPFGAETHTAPRIPGNPVQTFSTDMFRLYGELFGDPDFCELRFIFGSDYGLPGPGQTTLTELASGDFAVDSFFDITYQIQFIGCPGSVLEGYAGTTTATINIQTEPPATDCVPLADASGCEPVVCPVPTDGCAPSCVNWDPQTGITFVEECDCRDPTEWTLVLDDSLPNNACVVTDNGAGTITLPPSCCEYLSPDEVYLIIDGLPAGSTIELDGPFSNFLCTNTTGFCTLPIPPGECEIPGGSLGGDGHCFEGTLQLALTGTGGLNGFNRVLAIPMSSEAHTGPRNPGDAEQLFPSEMRRYNGELFGDPDFDVLNIRGGADNGLPGPGQTSLTRLPSGDFAVDSFFDITYQIEFEGAPGSQLEGYAGTTTATIRVETGITLPSCNGICPADSTCTMTQVPQPDDTLDICCVITPVVPSIFADGFEDGNLLAWSSSQP
ncbi:MAG: hypothetical protein K8R59_04400 [Thermoanaerobaculales bacterium]|nr:hypothetical protein [Thermoanaerobaculales bacterium]